MKYLILLILSSIHLNSQSFDWEVDNRLPFNIPKTYIAGGLSYGLSNHNGNININHQLINNAQFKLGEGNNFNIYLEAEHWYKEDLTFNIIASYSTMSDFFSTNESYPIFNGSILNLKNNYEINNKYLSIHLASKYRIYDKLNLALSLAYNLEINSNHKFQQNVISPNWYTFRNGEKSSVVFDEENFNSNNLIIISFNISYDIQLNYPTYISPFISFSNNLNNTINNSDINTYLINFGLKYYFGIKIN